MSNKNSLNDPDVIARAKERLLQGKGGLGVSIHPLLKGIAVPQAASKGKVLKSARNGFDAFSVNPYLNQGGVSQGHRRPKGLQFNTHGKYIEQANKLREQLREAKLLEEELAQKRDLGLVPLESLGEESYRVEYPPSVEWWDQPYLKDRDYSRISDESRIVIDAEDAPISIYIQHPPLSVPTWAKHVPAEKPMYLTKKEMKRIRRNDRLSKLKDKQDRIKLGLDAPPPPKVKLSNLMSVLTNEATSDPTAVEMRVKSEVQQRLEVHLQENEKRKLTPEQRHDKILEQQQNDIAKGYHTTVYKIDKLVNPQHIYKIDVNAKQLGLCGVCLLNPRFSLVVVEGGSKGIKFYKKLLTSRIKWEESSAATEPAEPPQDLKGNKCTVIWEGQLKELTFKRWSVNRSASDDDALDFLRRFGVENYWRGVGDV